MIKYHANEHQSFTVPADFPQMWLSKCLIRLGISLNLRRKIKHHGLVRVNGVLCPWNVQVDPGTDIQIEWNISSKLEPEDIPLQIVYEDDWLLIVNKPAGLLVHPGPGQPSGTLANAVLHHYRSQGQSHAFHPVQRLDRNTSGLLVIAKLSSIQHLMNKQLLKRSYLAVVTGTPASTHGVIDFPIARDPNSIILRIVSPEGQKAITHYQVLQSFSNASLLQLELQTGRTHQIRLHLSHIGHPLLGDDLYGGHTNLITRQALHSSSIELLHPISGTMIHLASPLPSDLQQLLHLLSQDTS